MTDIDLSLDDKYLYVACFGLGEMHQYDVTDPMNPVLPVKLNWVVLLKEKNIQTVKTWYMVPKWSRLVEMENVFIGLTPSTRPGMINSIRTRGWPNGHGRCWRKWGNNS